jgi:hypothetical protein
MRRRVMQLPDGMTQLREIKLREVYERSMLDIDSGHYRMAKCAVTIGRDCVWLIAVFQ